MCSGSRGARSRVEFETRAIHAGQEPDPLTGSVNVPIYQTSTYAQDGVLQMRGGHDYARTINPTRTALEQCLAALEGGAHGVCFSSGMAATTAIMELFSPGSRTVAINDVYGGTYRLFSKLYEPKGYDYEFLDLTDEGVARQAFEQPADLVWLETPSNPLLKIIDVAAIAERAHAAGALVVVDNTFASPYLQQPLSLGADIVVHSTTKYVGGHSDAIGGAAITGDDETAERLHFVQNSMGAVPGPLDCFLTLRGAKTLAVRMERHCDNATVIARWLTESPAVSHVYYPGLATHPGHETARRQMRRFGGMIAFQVRGGRAAVDAALAETGIWTLGESLGGVESLIEHPGAMTHASLAGSGFEVPDDLIRLSVGIEHVDDLLHDLVAMLARATQSRSRPLPGPVPDPSQ
jgi:cystathionine gamma-synthase